MMHDLNPQPRIQSTTFASMIVTKHATNWNDKGFLLLRSTQDVSKAYAVHNGVEGFSPSSLQTQFVPTYTASFQYQ